MTAAADRIVVDRRDLLAVLAALDSIRIAHKTPAFNHAASAVARIRKAVE